MSQNPYLPDGCTDADLDRAVGDCPDDDEYGGDYYEYDDYEDETEDDDEQQP